MKQFEHISDEVENQVCLLAQQRISLEELCQRTSEIDAKLAKGARSLLYIYHIMRKGRIVFDGEITRGNVTTSAVKAKTELI